MNIKVLLAGLFFFIVGLIMYLNIRKRKPASEKNNWEGQALPQFVSFWITAWLAIITGIALILGSF